MIFLWFALGWVVGMVTALVIGWYASKRHDKNGEQDAEDLFV